MAGIFTGHYALPHVMHLDILLSWFHWIKIHLICIVNIFVIIDVLIAGNEINLFLYLLGTKFSAVY